MTGDLISREALLEFAHNHVGGTIDCNDIARFPAVNAAPVVHAKWMIERCAARCTHCGIGYRLSNGGPNAMRFKFCPNCGAKMDLEE